MKPPVDELRFHFGAPVRLDEVTLSGPGGVIPMMIHAVGENVDYSVPMPDLEPGTYIVNWRATAAGTQHRGRFSFVVFE